MKPGAFAVVNWSLWDAAGMLSLEAHHGLVTATGSHFLTPAHHNIARRAAVGVEGARWSASGGTPCAAHWRGPRRQAG